MSESTSPSILLHPLVIINISDHATRNKVCNNGKYKRSVGVLLGNQQGKQIELLNSFELLTIESKDTVSINTDEKVIIDEQFLKTKLTQCMKQILEKKPHTIHSYLFSMYNSCRSIS